MRSITNRMASSTVIKTTAVRVKPQLVGSGEKTTNTDVNQLITINFSKHVRFKTQATKLKLKTRSTKSHTQASN